MYSKNTKKNLRQQFNAYADEYNDGDTQMFYTASHVVLIKRSAQGLRMQISNYDEDLQNPRKPTDTTPFESDPLWTPERKARKATAESLAAFIAQTKKREDHTQKTGSKKQDSDLRLGSIRIVLG